MSCCKVTISCKTVSSPLMVLVSSCFEFFLQLQRRLDPCEQFHFLKRFLDVIRRPGVERGPQGLRFAAGGHHDDRDVAQGLDCLDATASLDSVDLRYPDVHYNQVDLFRSSSVMFQVKAFERVVG